MDDFDLIENYYALFLCIIWPWQISPDEAFLALRGIKYPQKRVLLPDVAEMSKLHAEGRSYQELAVIYKLNKYRIYRAVKRYRDERRGIHEHK